MDADLKKFTCSDSVANGLSEPSDVDDQMALEDMADDDSFEIPLKTRYSRSSNFSELTDDLSEGRDGNTNSGSVEKKVRFEPGDGRDGQDAQTGDALNHGVSRSRSDSIKGKKNIEDLLQYANQVNDYLAQNLEKINTFRSELLSNDHAYKPLSDVATQATTISASMSNFELSDNENDEHDALAGPTVGEISKNDMSFFNKSNDSLMKTVSKKSSPPDTAGSHSDDNIYRENPSIDHTLENSPQLNESKGNTDVLNSPELTQHIQKLAINLPFDISNVRTNTDFKDEKLDDHPTPGKCSLVLSHSNTRIHETPDLSPEQGIEVLQDTIDLILYLSKSDTLGVVKDQEADSNEFANFNMKSTPTVTYKQFISRIQCKCMFGSIVYLAAALLIQTLFLTRDKPDGSLILRRRLQETQTHRLIIATVRVATKLLEDFVHSHQYFCKVCGVSKKLLTRLEVALIICLKNDGLVITSEKLAATQQIRDELRADKSNRN